MNTSFQLMYCIILYILLHYKIHSVYSIKLTEIEKMFVVNTHNFERELLSKKYNAKHFQNIMYNDDLENDSNEWNEYLGCLPSINKFVYGSKDLSRIGWQGQNYAIVNSNSNFSNVFDHWRYNFDKNYTQAIWPYTWLVGCSKIYCNKYKRYVCNYFPLGNVFLFHTFDDIFTNSSKRCFKNQTRLENNLCDGCYRPFAPVPYIQSMDYYYRNSSIQCIQ